MAKKKEMKTEGTVNMANAMNQIFTDKHKGAVKKTSEKKVVKSTRKTT